MLIYISFIAFVATTLIGLYVW